MIFTPADQFDHKLIRQVKLLKSSYSDILENSISARLRVTIEPDSTLMFYNDEALSVIDQLLKVGYYDEEQHGAVRSLMISYQLADINLAA